MFAAPAFRCGDKLRSFIAHYARVSICSLSCFSFRAHAEVVCPNQGILTITEPSGKIGSGTQQQLQVPIFFLFVCLLFDSGFVICDTTASMVASSSCWFCFSVYGCS